MRSTILNRQPTQVEGSIVCAAERSNLCGLKPTVGLVSRDLVIVSKRLGSVGPLAQCVKDIAGILGVIAGKCERDPGTNSIPFGHIPDYPAFCRVDGLRGARIGVPRHALRGCPPFAELTPVVSSAFEIALETLRQAGAIMVENTEFEAFDDTLESKCPSVVKSSDLKAKIENYFRGLILNPSGVENIHDLIRYTHIDPREDYPSQGTKTLENVAEAIDDQSSSEFQAALKYVRYLANEGGVGGTMKRHELDAIVLPTCVAPIMPAIGGYPILSVPLGLYPEQAEVKWNPRHEMIERGPGLP